MLIYISALYFSFSDGRPCSVFITCVRKIFDRYENFHFFSFAVYVSRHEKYKISETVHHFFKHSLVNLRVRGEGDENEIIFVK